MQKKFLGLQRNQIFNQGSFFFREAGGGGGGRWEFGGAKRFGNCAYL